MKPLCETQCGRHLVSHASRRRLPDLAEKGGAGPSSAMKKWPFTWPWFRHSITLRSVAVPSPLKRAIWCLPRLDAATASPAATYAATAASPMVEYVDPAPVVTYAAPAPEIEYTAPAPAMTRVASSQQLPPACTITTDTTDDNFDITDLVHTQISSASVETFAPHVVCRNRDPSPV